MLVKYDSEKQARLLDFFEVMSLKTGEKNSPIFIFYVLFQKVAQKVASKALKLNFMSPTAAKSRPIIAFSANLAIQKTSWFSVCRKDWFDDVTFGGRLRRPTISSIKHHQTSQLAAQVCCSPEQAYDTWINACNI